MRYIPITLALLLVSCASTGTQVSEEQASQFQKGKTTEAEVIARLGQPDSTTRSEDGSRVDAYTYSSASATWEDFVPYVNLLAGGTKSKYTTVAFSFDKAGVLKGWTSTGGKMDINTGLLNQK